MHDPNAIHSRQAMATEAPRYELQDLKVREPQVNLILEDKGAEDGDFVTVEVNGRVYAANMMLCNSANSIPVSLNPGSSSVKVTFLSGLKAWQSRYVDDEGHTEEGLSSSWEHEVV